MITLQGKVEQILIAPNPDALESETRTEVQVSFAGFEGDRHSGLTMRSNSRTPHYARGTEIRNTRQVSIVSMEELASIAEALSLPHILPEWLGANLCLSGIARLSQLPPMTRLFFEDGVVLALEGGNKPCTTAGKVIQARNPERTDLAGLFPNAGLGLRGVVAWVEKPGRIRAGEALTVQVPDQTPYVLAE